MCLLETEGQKSAFRRVEGGFASCSLNVKSVLVPQTPAFTCLGFILRSRKKKSMTFGHDPLSPLENTCNTYNN